MRCICCKGIIPVRGPSVKVFTGKKKRRHAPAWKKKESATKVDLGEGDDDDEGSGDEAEQRVKKIKKSLEEVSELDLSYFLKNA